MSDDQMIRCWCGEEGLYDEMYDEDGLDLTCGGTGQLYCYCGGDFCACHHHGQIECPGCPECGADESLDELED